jgi:hypothetical protein
MRIWRSVGRTESIAAATISVTMALTRRVESAVEAVQAAAATHEGEGEGIRRAHSGHIDS